MSEQGTRADSGDVDGEGVARVESLPHGRYLEPREHAEELAPDELEPAPARGCYFAEAVRDTGTIRCA